MYVLANSFSLPETIGMISESVLTTRWAELTGLRFILSKGMTLYNCYDS